MVYDCTFLGLTTSQEIHFSYWFIKVNNTSVYETNEIYQTPLMPFTLKYSEVFPTYFHKSYQGMIAHIRNPTESYGSKLWKNKHIAELNIQCFELMSTISRVSFCLLALYVSFPWQTGV